MRNSIIAILFLAACSDQPPDETWDEQAATSCPAGTSQANTGPSYSYRYNGASFRWDITRQYGKAEVLYHNYRTDGSFSAHGTISRWQNCGEAIQVISANTGQSWSCKHNCLADGREEINCPTVQLELTKIAEVRCVNPTSLTPTYDDTCDIWRPECLDWGHCAQRCIERIADDTEATECIAVCMWSELFGIIGSQRGSSSCNANPCLDPPGGGGVGGGGGGGTSGGCVIGAADLCPASCFSCNRMAF
jgi:hypothetical protein